jgi:transcriptional regulator with XRE-family HTH domain
MSAQVDRAGRRLHNLWYCCRTRGTREKARMTLREIAEAAGISIGTVDRVLHGRGRVSAATKEKVEALIAESDYKPNLVARQLKLNRHYSFACLIPSLGEDSGYWRIAYNPEGGEGTGALPRLRQEDRIQPLQRGIVPRKRPAAPRGRIRRPPHGSPAARGEHGPPAAVPARLPHRVL